MCYSFSILPINQEKIIHSHDFYSMSGFFSLLQINKKKKNVTNLDLNNMKISLFSDSAIQPAFVLANKKEREK